MYKKVLISNILKQLEKIQFGTFTLELEDNKTYSFSGTKRSDLKVHLSLKSNLVLKNLVFEGDVALARDYRNGLWDCNNVSYLIEWAILNEAVLSEFIFGSFISQIFNRIKYLFKRNTIKNSKTNIYEHYDLGNDFYSMWLDETMTYSSAIFKSSSETLSEAQSNKYSRILDMTDKNSNILEIGCGWGGFMESAMRAGRSVDGLTISEAQFEYAKSRISKNLKMDANIYLRDYRLHRGLYKNIVSIEMFEAVGEAYWGVYFEKIRDCLHRTGMAIIQTITIANEKFDSYRKSGDAIRSYIFPGGMLASKEKFEEEARDKNLDLVDKFSFGLDYAKTLELWLKNFESKKSEILKLNFDESFFRLWKFYLSYCIGAFRSKRIDVMQASLVHRAS